jgi:GINS complex subunit 2
MILNWEIEHPEAFSPQLPWRWLETAEILLSSAADDIPDAGIGGERDLRVLLRGLREVRQTKAREGLKQLESTYLQMNGLGLLEITELRGFAGNVVDGLRRLGATREESRRAEEEEGADDDDDTQGSVYRTSTVGRSTTVGRSSAAIRGSSTAAGRSSVGFDDDDF